MLFRSQAQTPWLSAIDGNGQDLNAVNRVSARLLSTWAGSNYVNGVTQSFGLTLSNGGSMNLYFTNGLLTGWTP